jgi:hypothetical protein
MKRADLLRIAVPGLLVPLSLALLAFALPWTRGSDNTGAKISETDAEPTATREPVDVSKQQGDIFQWWISVATATAPTPTPSLPRLPGPRPTTSRPRLPAATAPPGIAYGPEERG